MSSETIKYFYEEIKLITEEIGKTGLPEKLIEAANEQNLNKMELISRQFKKDNLELWGRIALFYEEYCESKLEIFGNEAVGLYQYYPSEIDPLNLCVLLALSFGNVDESILFADWRDLQSAISKEGYLKIANCMENTYFDNLKFLIDAYY